ncbi:MAG TPA: hypothetical protein VE623_15590 [Acidimicrobiales bacterium]|nr:hypothetical protein [Acidimicrobiales bacterium]
MRDVFVEHDVIARWPTHKERNVLDHLPDEIARTQRTSSTDTRLDDTVTGTRSSDALIHEPSGHYVRG